MKNIEDKNSVDDIPFEKLSSLEATLENIRELGFKHIIQDWWIYKGTYFKITEEADNYVDACIVLDGVNKFHRCKFFYEIETIIEVSQKD